MLYGVDLFGSTQERELGRDVDAAADAAVHRAAPGVDVMSTLGDALLFCCCAQSIPHMNAADDEHAILLLDLAFCFRYQASCVRRNPARLQRAPQGTGQSASGRRDHVVECGGPLDIGLTSVMRRHGSVDAEVHRILASRYPRAAIRPFHALDANA